MSSSNKWEELARKFIDTHKEAMMDVEEPPTHPQAQPQLVMKARCVNCLKEFSTKYFTRVRCDTCLNEELDADIKFFEEQLLEHTKTPNKPK